jgi:hypothetical protein
MVLFRPGEVKPGFVSSVICDFFPNLKSIMTGESQLGRILATPRKVE